MLNLIVGVMQSLKNRMGAALLERPEFLVFSER
jgi:hypothetical protein